MIVVGGEDVTDAIWEQRRRQKKDTDPTDDVLKHVLSVGQPAKAQTRRAKPKRMVKKGMGADDAADGDQDDEGGSHSDHDKSSQHDSDSGKEGDGGAAPGEVGGVGPDADDNSGDAPDSVGGGCSGVGVGDDNTDVGSTGSDDDGTAILHCLGASGSAGGVGVEGPKYFLIIITYYKSYDNILILYIT